MRYLFALVFGIALSVTTSCKDSGTRGAVGNTSKSVPAGEPLLFGSTLHPLAGGGLGDGGPAIAGDLSSPGSLVVDGAGNLYVADTAHHIIRKVDAVTGAISTFAGSGIAGYSEDGGLASAASLKRPFGLALDAAGNLYVGDSGNMRIRKVEHSTGIITTIAGNGQSGFSGDDADATAASFNFPTHPDGGGIAIQGDSLIVADQLNHRLRKIDLKTMLISTFAGTGTAGFAGDGGLAVEAQLNGPRDVSIDAVGNVFIADTGNNRIRKIDVNGIITTVVGSGRAGAYVTDGANAKDVDVSGPYHCIAAGNGDLYVFLRTDSRVLRVDHATNLTTTVAGGVTAGFSGDGGPATLAKLYRPVHGFLGDAGQLLFSDTGNNRIRQIDSLGVISTVAGTTAGFAGESVVGPAAEFKDPTAIARDVDGHLYIADTGNHRVRKLDAITALVTTPIGTGERGFGGDGGPAALAMLDGPTAVALDDARNIYIADTGNARIRRVDATSGVISTYAGSDRTGFAGDGSAATAAQLLIPSDIALDNAGNLYIADSGNHRIRRVDHATHIITTIVGDGTTGFPGAGDGGPAVKASLQYPSGLTVTSWGTLFVADSGHNSVRAVDLATGSIVTAAGTGVAGYSGDGSVAVEAALNRPRGLAVDEAGQIFVADTDNHAVRKIDYYGTGTIVTIAGSGSEGFLGDEGPATSAQLCGPTDVLLGDSAVYIVDRGNQRIRRL